MKRNCQYCGIEFESMHKRNIFHDEKCALAFNKYRRYKTEHKLDNLTIEEYNKIRNKEIMIKCVVCGVDFPMVRFNQLTCSPKHTAMLCGMNNLNKARAKRGESKLSGTEYLAQHKSKQKNKTLKVKEKDINISEGEKNYCPYCCKIIHDKYCLCWECFAKNIRMFDTNCVDFAGCSDPEILKYKPEKHHKSKAFTKVNVVREFSLYDRGSLDKTIMEAVA